jgi:hypothetical protein
VLRFRYARSTDAGRQADGALLERVARALGDGAGRDGDEPDDPTLPALKIRIEAIIEKAHRTGALEEGRWPSCRPRPQSNLRGVDAAECAATSADVAFALPALG